MNKQERTTSKLLAEQHPDGGFGRFHTMDSKLKRRIPTTQAAAWLMYDYGFTRDDDICDKTCLYMERLLNDLSLWPDAWEKNKWCKPAVPLFISSSLALFGSEDTKYKEMRDIWINILISSFSEGSYSKSNTDAAALKLLGVEIDGSYIGFHCLNTLALLACNNKHIPVGTQKSYITWLHDYDGVIGYTNIRPDSFAHNARSTRVLSLMSRLKGFNDVYPELAGNKEPNPIN